MSAITAAHELLQAHRRQCPVCHGLDRHSMCGIGQQLRDDITRARAASAPVDDHRFTPRRWRP